MSAITRVPLFVELDRDQERFLRALRTGPIAREFLPEFVRPMPEHGSRYPEWFCGLLEMGLIECDYQRAQVKTTGLGAMAAERLDWK